MSDHAGPQDDEPSSTAVSSLSSKRVQVATLVAGLLAIAVGAWWALRPGGESDRSDRSIGQTVSGFFQAQRDGDCERLAGLLTEASRSDGGRLSRGEFLHQCADAVDGYEPDVERLAVDFETVDDEGDHSREPDQAVVDSVLPATSSGIDPASYESEPDDGRLVREDGEWRIETGQGLLRIGRSVEQTVLGYVDAYNDGDCERLIDHLSEAAWSLDGELTRRQFLDQCADGAASRNGPAWQPPPQVTGIAVALDDDGRATADVAVAPVRRLGSSIDPDTVVVVKEGLEWKLHGSRNESDDVDVRRPLPAIDRFELQVLLAGEVVLPDESCFLYFDHPVGDLDDDGAPLGIRREFLGCDASPVLTMREYVDDDAARAAAEGLASQEDAVPGIPDAFVFRTDCDEDACRDAVALAVRDDLMVRVTLGGEPELDRLVTVLRAQLERL
jgi:hypothetical protein